MHVMFMSNWGNPNLKTVHSPPLLLHFAALELPVHLSPHLVSNSCLFAYLLNPPALPSTLAPLVSSLYPPTLPICQGARPLQSTPSPLSWHLPTHNWSAWVLKFLINSLLKVICTAHWSVAKVLWQWLRAFQYGRIDSERMEGDAAIPDCCMWREAFSGPPRANIASEIHAAALLWEEYVMVCCCLSRSQRFALRVTLLWPVVTSGGPLLSLSPWHAGLCLYSEPMGNQPATLKKPI